MRHTLWLLMLFVWTSPCAAQSWNAWGDPEPVPATSVCQCRGSSRGVCYCLQNGVTCGCNPNKGSEWLLNDEGRAYAKTGLYAHPAADPPSQNPRKTSPAVGDDQPGYAATRDTAGHVHWQAGGVTHWTTVPVSEGGRIAGGLVYRNGRVVPEAASTPPTSTVRERIEGVTGRTVRMRYCDGVNCYYVMQWQWFQR